MEIQKPEHNLPPLEPKSSLKSVRPHLLSRILGVFGKLLSPKKIIVIVVVLIVIFILRSVFFPSSKRIKDNKEVAQAPEEDLIPVKVFKVGRFNFEDSLNSLGTIKGGVEF